MLREVRTKGSYVPEKVKAVLEPLGLWGKVCKESVTKAAVEKLLKGAALPAEVRSGLKAALETESRPVVKLARAAGNDDEEENE